MVDITTVDFPLNDDYGIDAASRFSDFINFGRFFSLLSGFLKKNWAFLRKIFNAYKIFLTCFNVIYYVVYIIVIIIICYFGFKLVAFIFIVLIGICKQFFCYVNNIKVRASCEREFKIKRIENDSVLTDTILNENASSFSNHLTVTTPGSPHSNDLQAASNPPPTKEISN